MDKSTIPTKLDEDTRKRQTWARRTLLIISMAFMLGSMVSYIVLPLDLQRAATPPMVMIIGYLLYRTYLGMRDEEQVMETHEQ